MSKSVAIADTEFDRLLAMAGATPQTLSPTQKQTLDEKGYLLLPKVVDGAGLERLRAAFEQALLEQANPVQGTRHADLLNVVEVTERVCSQPQLLAAAYHILGREFRLNGVHGRDPLPGHGGQTFHADWMPRRAGQVYQVVTAIWMLDDFRLDNGPTRVLPATHLLLNNPPKTLSGKHRDEVLVTGQAGSILVFNGHLWHSGTTNTSQNQSRRALQCLFRGHEVQTSYTPIDPSLWPKLSPLAQRLVI